RNQASTETYPQCYPACTDSHSAIGMHPAAFLQARLDSAPFVALGNKRAPTVLPCPQTPTNFDPGAGLLQKLLAVERPSVVPSPLRQCIPLWDRFLAQ